MKYKCPLLGLALLVDIVLDPPHPHPHLPLSLHCVVCSTQTCDYHVTCSAKRTANSISLATLCLLISENYNTGSLEHGMYMKIILSVNLVAITEKLNIGHENDNGHESLAMESTLSTTAFSSVQSLTPLSPLPLCLPSPLPFPTHPPSSLPLSA